MNAIDREDPTRVARAVLAVCGWNPVALRPYPGDQRHRSYKADLGRGHHVWVKIEREASPVAGVAHEAFVIARLKGLAGVPQLLASGSLEDAYEYLVTADLPGRSLDARPDLDPESLTRIAGVLQSIGHCLDAASWQQFDGGDVFAAQPPLRHLLSSRPSAAALLATHPGLLEALLRQVTAEPIRLVHGSFDAGNVLVGDDGTPWVLDYEATRPGPSSLDVASMAGSLAATSLDLARRWISAADGVFGTAWCPANVAGFLLLRATYRHEVGASEGWEASLVPSLVAELLG